MGLQNHPSTGDDVIRIIEETDRPNFSFLLDTGQWCGSPARNRGIPDPDHDIYAYMQQTAHLATHVRAKFYKIDSGKEEWIDYERIVPILAEAGYNGPLSVVFEGQGYQRLRRQRGHAFGSRTIARFGLPALTSEHKKRGRPTGPSPFVLISSAESEGVAQRHAWRPPPRSSLQLEPLAVLKPHSVALGLNYLNAVQEVVDHTTGDGNHSQAQPVVRLSPPSRWSSRRRYLGVSPSSETGIFS